MLPAEKFLFMKIFNFQSFYPLCGVRAINHKLFSIQEHVPYTNYMNESVECRETIERKLTETNIC